MTKDTIDDTNHLNKREKYERELLKLKEEIRKELQK